MAVNYKNDSVVRLTTHDTFPLHVVKTGTITSTSVNGRIIGVGTKFTSELEVGGWICDIANDEIRKITSILNDLNLTVDHPFTTPLSGAQLDYVEPSVYVEISVFFNTVAGKIDGVPVAPNVGVGITKSSRDWSTGRDFVDPVVIDATGTVAYIIWVK